MARTHIVIDATGTITTVPYTPQEEADADAQKAADDLAQAPMIAQQQKVSAIRINARRQALLNAIITEDDVALIADINARYPSLPANAIKAIVDIFLLISPIIRS